MILVVDDDRNVCRILKDLLKKAGHEAVTADNVDSALPVIKQRGLDLIITDLKMPKKSGMDLLLASNELNPGVPVIIISAFGDIESAVSAIKQGAYDFITKPFDEDELLNVVRKALAESGKNQELVSAYFEIKGDPLPEIIGKSPEIRRVFEEVRKVAPTDSTVLITGETGVGKELVARALHMASRRKGKPFVKVNCAAIPETLLESELFGYEKGAFTGAVTYKPGRFEIAHRGTIFLDEIGEIPIHLQAKLLTVLQDREIERLGGVRTIQVDVRIIAATNKELQSAVSEGKFRPDLFYRLNVVPIHVPPLRERKDDLIPLSTYLLRKFAAKYGRGVVDLSPEAAAALSGYDWPGNIRELENVLERMIVMTETETLGPEQVPPEILGVEAKIGTSALKVKVDDISRAAERQMICDALTRTGQNRTKAAELLGISRRTLQTKIKVYGL